MTRRLPKSGDAETVAGPTTATAVAGVRFVNRAIDGILTAKIALDGLSDEDLLGALLADPIECEEWFATVNAARHLLERVDRITPATLTESNNVAA